MSRLYDAFVTKGGLLYYHQQVRKIIWNQVRDQLPSITGEGNITVLNSAYGYLLDVSIDGKSVQASTPSLSDIVPISSVADNKRLIITNYTQLFDKDSPDYMEGLTCNATNSNFETSESIKNRLYYVKCRPNTTYTFTKTKGTYCRFVSSQDKPTVNGEISVLNPDTSLNLCTITTGPFDNYLAFEPLSTSEIDSIGYDAVEKNIEIKAIETVTLELNDSLKSSGDVHDSIRTLDGYYGIYRRIKSTVFNGESTEGWVATGTAGQYKVKIAGGKQFAMPKCTHAVGKEIATTTVGQCYYDNNNEFIINTSYSTLNDFLAALASNPMTVFTVLAVPVFEPFEEDIQIQLFSLSSFDGNTTVFIGDSLIPMISFIYPNSDVAGLLSTIKNTLAANGATDDGTLARKFKDDVVSEILYVSAVNGSDENDGSEDKPFKSITKVLTKLPDVIGNTDVRIVIDAGEYNEDVVIKGYTGDLSFIMNGNVVINGCITVTGCSNVWFAVSDMNIANSLTINHTTDTAVKIYSSKITYNHPSLIVNTSPAYNGIVCSNSLVAIDATVTINNSKSGVYAVSASNVFIATLNGDGEYSCEIHSGSIVTIGKNQFNATEFLFYRDNDALAQSKYSQPISETEYNALEEAGLLDPDTIYYVMSDEEYDDQFGARNIDFDDTFAKLSAVNVQQAIEKVNEKVEDLSYVSDRLEVIEDALLVDLYNIKSPVNKRIRVQKDISINMPLGCEWGTREVYWMSSNKLVVAIIGMSTYGSPKVWYNIYNGTQWYGWDSVNDYLFRDNAEGYTALVHDIDIDTSYHLRIREDGRVAIVPRENNEWQNDETEFLVTETQLDEFNEEYETVISQNIAYDITNNKIQCHGTIVRKKDNKCDIHLSMSVRKINKSDTSVKAISKSRLCTILGVNDLSWNHFDTKVAIVCHDKNVDMDALCEHMGLSGLMISIIEDAVGFGRWYEGQNSYGLWPINTVVYEEKMVYNVDIYGATYN